MDSNCHNQPSELFNFQHHLPHTIQAITDQLWFLPYHSHNTWMSRRTHCIPTYCPSALIFLKPPRGIEWDFTAMECSPLAHRSKYLGAKRKGTNNKITGFVALQIYQEVSFVFVSAWSGLGKKTSLRKATVAAVQRKPPKALTQRNGEVLPLVMLFFDHTCPWNGYTTLSKPLAYSFPLSLLIRSRHQHQLKKNWGHSRAEAQYINRLSFYSTVCLTLTLTTRM